jgi:hypothetical protein
MLTTGFFDSQSTCRPTATTRRYCVVQLFTVQRDPALGVFILTIMKSALPLSQPNRAGAIF